MTCKHYDIKFSVALVGLFRDLDKIFCIVALPYNKTMCLGEMPNTVILDYYDGCLTDSCACLAAARSHRKLGSRFRFDRSLLAPPATTLGLSFPNMHAHLREYACSCPRGKISGPGLFAWI